MKSLTIGIILALVVIAAVAIYFGAFRSAGALQAPQAQPVSFDSPRAAATPSNAQSHAVSANSNTVKAIGNFVSASQATISFQVIGRIKEMRVKEGDKVKAGAVVVTLDTSILDAQIAQAQAALESANVNLDKVKQGPAAEDIAIARSRLDLARAAVNQAQAAYDKIGGNSNPAIAITAQALTLEQATATYQGALATYQQTVNHPTPTELKTAQAAVAQAQAALEVAKQGAGPWRAVAPIDGVVIWVGPRVGESVAIAVPVMTISDLTKMQVQVGVDETTLGSIQIGQTVTISTDSLPDISLTGRVSKIGLQGTTTAGIITVPVTIDVDPSDANIYPGLSATVEISIGK